MSGTGSPQLDAVLAAAAVLAALGVLWRGTRPGRRLAAAVLAFLEDWNGEPGRPGRPATHPFPERLSRIEAKLVELPQLTLQLDQLGSSVLDTGTRVAQLDDRLALIDRRVADHRARNDRQVELLREEVNLRLRQLTAYRAVLADDPEPSGEVPP